MQYKSERAAVFSVLADGKWRTLTEISRALDGNYSESGISARVRQLRHDGFTIDKRKRAGSKNLWEYRIAHRQLTLPTLPQTQPDQLSQTETT